MKNPKFIQIVPPYIPLPLKVMHDKEDYFLLPARVMKEKGFDVEFVTLKHKKNKYVEQKFFEELGNKEEVYSGFPIKRFSNIFSMYFYILRQKCILHVHLRPYPPSQFAGLLPKPKIIRTFTYVMGSTWLVDALSSILLKRFNRIFAVTPYEMMVYADHSIPSEIIRHIPLAIDYKFFTEKTDYGDIMKKYGISKSDFVIVAVANIRKHKRYDVLLKAFKIVKAKVKNAKLIIIGDDCLHSQDLPSLKSLVSKLGLKDVILTGHQNPDFVRKAYALSKCFVHSAENEFQGLVSYEAAAVGIPVCLSNIGSHTSVFKGYALYHDVEDYKTLAENMIKCHSPDEAIRLNVKFLKEYMKKWDYDRIKNVLSDAYDEVIKESGVK